MSPRIDVQVLQTVQTVDLQEQKRPETLQEVHLLDRLEHLGPGKTLMGLVGVGEGRAVGLGIRAGEGRKGQGGGPGRRKEWEKNEKLAGRCYLCRRYDSDTYWEPDEVRGGSFH